MSRTRYKPQNFDQILANYAKTEENRIRQEYNKLYDEMIDNLEKTAQLEVDDVLSKSEKHESLRSMALRPFIEKSENKEIFKYFELLFNDALYFLKTIQELEENIPTLDFIIAEFSDEGVLVSLILGEIKGQKAHYTTDSLNKIVEEYRKPEMLDKILQNIKKS